MAMVSNGVEKPGRDHVAIVRCRLLAVSSPALRERANYS